MAKRIAKHRLIIGKGKDQKTVDPKSEVTLTAAQEKELDEEGALYPEEESAAKKSRSKGKDKTATDADEDPLAE